ncbi:unnamed protein product [marine sediment metagenome]|uniref:Uncharacterized protein n=1 Tax=marine sediment metagenome TaxID=412755 RepID=X0ZKQ3_9ZZZZ
MRILIVVKKKNEKQFIVKVEEEGTAKDYSVTLYDDYYQKLTGGRITKEELIRKSFKFLLKREPRDSILSKFNLKIISNYFPEYEKVIKSK